MPQKLEVDHEQVKCVALQVGVREAARQYGLPEDTVRQWSSREKWFAHKELADKAMAIKIEKQGMSPVVTKTPSDVMIGLGEKSKLLGAKVGHKTLKHMHKAEGEELTAQASAFKCTVDALAKLHQWGESTVNQTLVNINLLGADYGESPK